jgi:hypothetical protein
MTMRLDLAIEAVVPDLPATRVIVTVPIKRSSAVEFAYCGSQIFKPVCAQEQVIMVRQEAPRI